MIREAESGLGLLDSIKLVDGPQLIEKLVALQQPSSVRKLQGQMPKILAARTPAHEIQIHPARSTLPILLILFCSASLPIHHLSLSLSLSRGQS